MLSNPMMFQRQTNANFYCSKNANPYMFQKQYQQYHQQTHYHQMLNQLHQQQQQPNMRCYHRCNYMSNGYNVQQNITYQQQQNYHNRPAPHGTSYYPHYNGNINNNIVWNNQNNCHYQSYQSNYTYDQGQKLYNFYTSNMNNKSNNLINNKQSGVNLSSENKKIKNNQSPVAPNNISNNPSKLPMSSSNCNNNPNILNINSNNDINNQKASPSISNYISNKFLPSAISKSTSPIKKESVDKQIMTDLILKQIEDTTVIKIGEKYDYFRGPERELYGTLQDRHNDDRKETDCKNQNLESIYHLNKSINSSSSLVFNDLETSSELFRREDNESTTILNHIEIKLDNSIIKSQNQQQNQSTMPPPLPKSLSQHSRPISTKVPFDSTMEELKFNNLFLAQQRKVEEYENLHEEERKQNSDFVNSDINIRLRREFRNHNNLQGERSNPRYRCFNLDNNQNNSSTASSNNSSQSVDSEKKENNESSKTKFHNKLDNLNNKNDRLTFKINDQLMDSSLGKIKFLGVYKADPKNYFKNICKNKRYDKSINSMEYASLNENQTVKKEQAIGYLKESSTSSSKIKSEKYYKLVRDENGIMTLKEL